VEPVGTSDGLRRALLASLEERVEDLAAWRERLRGWRSDTGRELFSELIEILLGRALPEEDAERLVTTLLFRRAALTSRLGRDPGMAVAALDHVVHAEPWLTEPCVFERDALAREAAVRGRCPETSALTSDAWIAEVDREVARARRDGDGFAIVLFDVLSLPGAPALAPDQRAPQAALAHAARRVCRDPDVLGRIARSRFGLLAPATPRLGAYVLASAIVRRFSEDPAAAARAVVRAGVACHPHDADTARALVDSAMAAMRLAGTADRGSVVAHPRERRGSTRFPMSARARIAVTGPGFGRTCPARGLDLSRHGIRIDLDAGLREGDAVEVRIEIDGEPSAESVWGTTGAVVRREASAVRPGSARLGTRLDAPVPARVLLRAVVPSTRMCAAVGCAP